VVVVMPQLRCPICHKPIDPAEKGSLPFCSERCRQIDLRRWLGEEYGLPIERENEGDEEQAG
jgi:endogenous inhibitor of DNA gyrase (YacG/DUF329 family)